MPGLRDKSLEIRRMARTRGNFGHGEIRVLGKMLKCERNMEK